MKESDILYEKNEYFVVKAPKPKKGYEIYRNSFSGTHSVRVGSVGYDDSYGMNVCKEIINQRITGDF